MHSQGGPLLPGIEHIEQPYWFDSDRSLPPAEFGIKYFTDMGQRVVYTSPIKALSNEKYNDFSNKYPNISLAIKHSGVIFKRK